MDGFGDDSILGEILVSLILYGMHVVAYLSNFGAKKLYVWLHLM